MDAHLLDAHLLVDAHLLAATPSFGPYVAWWAALAFLIPFFVWVRLLTWIDKDVRRVMLPRETTNGAMMSALLLGVAAFFLLPGLPLALGVFLVFMVGSLAGYVGVRSKKADTDDLKKSLADEFLGRFKGDGKDKVDDSPAGDFTFTPKTGLAIRQPDVEDPNRVGYDALASILLEPLIKGAHTIELSPGGEQSTSRYLIDGIAYEGARVDKAQAAEAIAMVKRCFGGDVDERRKPQGGKFKMAFGSEKHEVQARTQGSSAGEALRIELDITGRYQGKVEEMGFVADQLQFMADQRDNGGVVVIATPKGQGLTSLEYAMLRNHDAFISQLMTVERHAPIDMEGVAQNKLDADASPEAEAQMVGWITSQVPGVVVLSNPQSRDSVRDLIRFADDEHRVYVGLKAGDVFEAVESWRKLVGDDALAMGKLRFVVAGRLFRRLCDETKVAYAPEEKLLKQLGMSSSRVTQLYKPNTSGVLRDEKGAETPDVYCHGIGYRGRFGVYELFNVDDEVRAAVVANVGTQGLRTLFRKQKRKYLQESALHRVETGDTSVQEFLRVLKPAEDKKPSSGKPSAAAKPAAAKPSSRPRPTA